jgi:hypothetical protein
MGCSKKYSHGKKTLLPAVDSLYGEPVQALHPSHTALMISPTHQLGATLIPGIATQTF